MHSNERLSNRSRSRLGMLHTSLLLIFSLGLAGCSLVCGEDRPVAETEYGGGDGVDVGSLTYQTFALFQSLDIPSELGPEVETTEYFDRNAREIKVHGSPVFFLEYGSEEESAEVAATIAQDGRSIGGKKLPTSGIMAGTPHFYRSGKVIAFYFGDRRQTLEALGSVIGEEFAGGGQLPESGESGGA